MVFNVHLYHKYFHGKVKCDDMGTFRLLKELQRLQVQREKYWLKRRNKITGDLQDMKLEFIDNLIYKDMELLMNRQLESLRMHLNVKCNKP